MTNTIICVDCGRRFWQDDSIGSDFGQCQRCWETYCDDEWWKMIQELDSIGALEAYYKSGGDNE